jgi:ribonuclease BN (tRNA processing enzyme)
MFVFGPGDVGGLLLDAGADVRRAMVAQGFGYRDVSAVYISHLHNDHIGGMEWLAFRSYFDPDAPKPRLIIAEEIVDELWKNALKGGMGRLDDGPAHLDTYFDVTTFRDGECFAWGDVEMSPVRVTHFVSANQESPSFGLMIRSKNRSSFLTTDARFDPGNLMPFYEAADVIFHDCETVARPTDVHAHFTQLSTLPGAICAKMWLYHYNDGELPDAEAAGFLGYTRPGQEFDL